MFIFAKGLFLDIPTNFHRNQFILGGPRAKDKLTPVFETRCMKKNHN